MKKTLIVFTTLLIIFSSCFQQSSKTFDSNKLNGKYKVDFTPLTNELNNLDDDTEKVLEKGVGKLAFGMIKMAFSTMEMKISFYEKNKGIIEVDGTIVNLIQSFTTVPIEKINNFWYKVENDSIVYFKPNEVDEFEKWAVVSKLSDNYDYIKIKVENDAIDQKGLYFNLIKINE